MVWTFSVQAFVGYQPADQLFLWTGLAGIDLSVVGFVSGFHATECHRAKRSNRANGLFSRPRDFAPVVGTPRRLEELPRPVALGGLRGILRRPLRPVSPEHEGVSEPLAQRKGAAAHQGRLWARGASPRSDLDGP